MTSYYFECLEKGEIIFRVNFEYFQYIFPIDNEISKKPCRCGIVFQL